MGFGDYRVELNTKGRYAVTALADLAKYGDGEAVSLANISERQQLPLVLERVASRIETSSCRSRKDETLLTPRPIAELASLHAELHSSRTSQARTLPSSE